MRLREVFKGYFSSGCIFTRINALFGLPFIDMITSVKELDIDFMEKFGRRELSCLVDDLINDPSIYDNLDYVVDNDGNYVVAFSNNVRVAYTSLEKAFIDILSDIIWQRYHLQWKKLYDTMIVSYNPIHNYDMSEQENVGTNIKTTDNYSNTSNSTDNATDNTKASNYGFNSTSATPVGENNNTSTDNSTMSGTNTGTREVDGDIDENVRKLTRQGNIGVTTSQKMLNDERETWKYDFINIVFTQVADMLTSKVYVL